MNNLVSLHAVAKRLPAQIIRELGMHHLSPEDKRAFAEDVWQRVDERLYELIWEGAANDEVMDSLQTEYEINPNLTPEEVITILMESQPDLPEKIEQELENIYQELIKHN
ncbi:hypothetical protein K9N08_02130 [Candidatus Gracilibacteria bacterium]|nr:hypothetical protein [Candidatus Gracilibacteria bacterium]MCF7896724.1 hypothetical protein [Candidatus Gracilibacteria bacterium]